MLVGRLVHYQLTESDVTEIYNLRQDAIGCRANPHEVGQVLPALVVKEWSPNSLDLQVFVDGNFTLWRTSIARSEIGQEFGRWAPPQREMPDPLYA